MSETSVQVDVSAVVLDDLNGIARAIGEAQSEEERVEALEAFMRAAVLSHDTGGVWRARSFVAWGLRFPSKRKDAMVNRKAAGESAAALGLYGVDVRAFQRWCKAGEALISGGFADFTLDPTLDEVTIVRESLARKTSDTTNTGAPRTRTSHEGSGESAPAGEGVPLPGVPAEDVPEIGTVSLAADVVRMLQGARSLVIRGGAVTSEDVESVESAAADLIAAMRESLAREETHEAIETAKRTPRSRKAA